MLISRHTAKTYGEVNRTAQKEQHAKEAGVIYVGHAGVKTYSSLIPSGSAKKTA